MPTPLYARMQYGHYKHIGYLAPEPITTLYHVLHNVIIIIIIVVIIIVLNALKSQRYGTLALSY